MWNWWAPGTEEQINGERKKYLRIEPNPVLKKAKIFCRIQHKENAQLELYDLSGRMVRKFELTNQIEFNTSNMPAGYYFLQLTMGQYTKRVKLIILK